jgi:MinD-like ATPase involved in chromosome partitioning or flagellar assembly
LMVSHIILSERLKRVKKAKVIKLVSGQGGVGKSLIAAYLADIYANAGLFCLLYDGDHSMGLLDQYSNSILSRKALPREPEHKISDVITAGIPLEKTVDRTYGFDLVPSQLGNTEVSDLSPKDISLLESQLEKMLSYYDVAVIDSSSGIGRSSFIYTRLADELICVSCPDRISLTTGYAAAKVASIIYGRNQTKWLLNKAHDDKAIDFSSGPYRKAGLEIESLGSLPFTESILKGVHALPPYSPFIRQLEIIADQLYKASEER